MRRSERSARPGLQDIRPSHRVGGTPILLIAAVVAFVSTGARAENDVIRRERFPGAVRTSTVVPPREEDPANTAPSESASDQNSLPPRRGGESVPASRRSVVNQMTPAGFADMVWPLCVVLAVAGLAAWTAKRWMPRGMRAQTGGSALRIIARQAISPKQSICLVRVGRRLLVVASTPDRVSTLSEITDPEETSQMIASFEKTSPGSFTTAFQQAAATELTEDPSETVSDDAGEELRGEADDGVLTPNRELASARERVQSLLGRVRSVSSGLSSPAEPVRRVAGLR